jgi:hypothetical protein
MNPEDFAGLDISRYRLVLRAAEPASLPVFLGSTLRGAFGRALKDAVCVVAHRNCDRCLLYDRCIYPYLFETPAPAGVPQLRGQTQAPHPFILTPPVLNADRFRNSTESGRDRFLAHNTESDSGGVPSTPAQSSTSSPRRSEYRLQPAVGSSAFRRGFAPAPVRLIRGPVIRNDRLIFAPGDELSFGLLLMGPAVEHLPYVVYAVSQMAQHGLGADRSRFRLAEVRLIDERDSEQTIYSGSSNRIKVPEYATQSLAALIRARLASWDRTHPCVPPFGSSAFRGLSSDSSLIAHHLSLTVSFLTPARIRVEGDLQSAMSFELLIRNLLRRVSLLAAVHGGAPLELDYRDLIAKAAEVETVASRLSWWDWERFSNRQKTRMNMGGFTGEVEYAGEQIEQFLPLLGAGEILNVGSGTSFGLGSYQVRARTH